MAYVTICEGSDVIRRVIALILQSEGHRTAFGVATPADRPDVQTVGTNVGGWAVVVAEARALGVPVLLLADGGIPAYLLQGSDDVTIIRKPFDVDDLIGAVQALAAPALVGTVWAGR